MTFVVLHPNLPDIEVAVAFGNNPTDSPLTWTDVTPYVRGLEYRRGRQSELARSEAGEAVIALDNRDGRFTPTNTASPYTPNVVPMVPVRIRARWSGVVYDRFVGYAESWTPTWPGDGLDAVVELEAVDAIAVLNLYDLGGKSYAAALTGTRFSAVLTDCGLTGGAVSLGTGQSTIIASGTLTTGTGALSHLQSCEETENGTFYPSRGGTLVLEDRHHRIKNETASQGTIGDGAGEIPYRELTAAYDAYQLWNECKMTPDGGTVETAVDTSSTAKYFKRTLDRALLISSQSEALSAAQWNLARYKDPALRTPSVTILGAANAATAWPVVLTVDISDRVTRKRRPPGGGTISDDQHVEAVAERVSLDRGGPSWDTTWTLSPATSEAFWILGNAQNSLLGQTTRLGY